MDYQKKKESIPNVSIPYKRVINDSTCWRINPYCWVSIPYKRVINKKRMRENLEIIKVSIPYKRVING